MVKNLKEVVLATISYFDIFEYPLTLLEIKQYIINPQRLFPKSPPIGDISLSQIANEIDRLSNLGDISEENGFYFLTPPLKRRVLNNMPSHVSTTDNNSFSTAGFETRIEREKISTQKFRRLLKLARYFQAVPYLRGIFVSGSLAISNASPESDYDVLVIMRENRLYLGRIFLSLAASLLRARRTRYQKFAPDKFCFNHYLCDKNLHLNHESIYNAQTYATLKPILISHQLYDEFYRSNLWINKFVYNFKPGYESNIRKVKPSRFLKNIATFSEKVLDGRFGDFLEGLAKKYQQKRISNNPATYESGGRIVFNDVELEFHPRSFESRVISRYNQFLHTHWGAYVSLEHDSGLAK